MSRGPTAVRSDALFAPSPVSSHERIEWKRLELENMVAMMKRYPDHVVYRLAAVRCYDELEAMRLNSQGIAESRKRSGASRTRQFKGRNQSHGKEN